MIDDSGLTCTVLVQDKIVGRFVHLNTENCNSVMCKTKLAVWQKGIVCSRSRLYCLTFSSLTGSQLSFVWSLLFANAKFLIWLLISREAKQITLIVYPCSATVVVVVVIVVCPTIIFKHLLPWKRSASYLKPIYMWSILVQVTCSKWPPHPYMVMIFKNFPIQNLKSHDLET